MIESTEKSVLMKCTVCRYEEKVPEWVLEELALGKYKDGYKMDCPNCEKVMVEKRYYDEYKK